MKKKALFSIIVSFAVLALLLTFSVSASKVISGLCGTNVKYVLDDDGTLTISGSGDMIHPSSYQHVPWSSNCEFIKNVVISDGVTSICNYAFLNCISLTSVTIPDSVTKIGHSAFYNCKKLESIYLSDKITSIGNWAFSYCTAITEIRIPESVTSIGNFAFYNCTGITRISVDTNNKYYANDARGVLFNKAKTNLIQYPAGNTTVSYVIPSTVTDIGNYAFSHNAHLKRISIPSCVINISKNAFYNTLFYNNSDNWEGDVLYIGSHLIASKHSLSGDYTVKPGTLTIAGNAFTNCYALGTITIPESVVSISPSALGSCERITVDSANQNYSSDASGVLFNKDKTVLIKYPSKSTNSSYQIPSTVKSIGNYAFSYCSNLKNVTFSQNSKLTSIGDGAFFECSALSYLTVPVGTTKIGSYAFDSCHELKSIKIHDSVTDIGNYAFFSCTDLTVSGFYGSFSQEYALLLNIPFVVRSPVYGDVKGDETVDVLDAIAALKLIAINSFSTLTNSQRIASDVTHDGSIDVSDVIRILRHIVNPNVSLAPDA